MKKFFGKVLVGAVGCMMALGISAFAANEVTINAPVVKDDGTVTISGTVSGDAAAVEATILVIPSGKSLADNIADADIKYINQDTTSDNGAFTFTFKLDPGTDYTVYCGGTDVVKPDEKGVTFTSADTFKIVGQVTLLTNADATKVTATATGKEAVHADKDGKYEILDVANGTYDVVVGRAGYLYKTYSGVEVANEDKNLGTIALVAGDLATSDPAYVNLDDLQALLNAYGKMETEEGYSEVADLNDDKMISVDDLQALLNSFGKYATDYE